jgi:hypothetical protein
LKRFESSAFAFCRTLDKLIREHRAFIDALDRGHVVTTKFMHELAASDEGSLDELLSLSDNVSSAGDYDLKSLRSIVANDVSKLERLCAAAKGVTPARDPKLSALIKALEKISSDADNEAISEDDARQKRKVIVFSFFSDIRANRPPDEDGRQVNNALDILEAPWPRREEILLRDWFQMDDVAGTDKARLLVARILESGLEPFNQPKLLPPIDLDDIGLVCWMGVIAA